MYIWTIILFYHHHFLICFPDTVHGLQGTEAKEATATENRRIPQRPGNETKDDKRPA